MKTISVIVGCALALVTSALGAPSQLDSFAEAYVKLALAAGVHDGDLVDDYNGPAEWRTAAESAKLPLTDIRRQAQALAQSLTAVDATGFDEMTRLRQAYLGKLLQALDARLAVVSGEKIPFDEESRRIFDAVAPTHPAAYFDALLADLDQALPGPGTVSARFQAYRNQFIIPPARLDAVFRAAIAAARERTLKHIALPANEAFTLEYVTGKSWSGYNWFKGGAHSLIQINTDLPIFIDRAVDLAAHEGYPGHHVCGVLREQKLRRERGWVEFSVNQLFGPNAIIAEGSANYGIDVVFPGEERLAFEREVLFPLAGLNPARVGEYYRVLGLTKKLSFAGNEAARRYLDGAITAAEAAAWLEKYTLMEPARALQRVKFIEKYRSYVITYNHGQQLVGDAIEAQAGGDTDRRWAALAALISSPRLPSQLK